MPQAEPGLGVLRAARVGAELQHDVEQFLFLEAQLLDAGSIAEWLTLLTDDVRYFMPIRTNRNPRERDREWTGANDVALFDETKASLTMRLHKLNSGAAWAEEPRSHTRHLVTNVRIRPQPDETLAVQSSFIVYRNRAERQADLLVGERHDLLHRVDTQAGFVLASRRILLDQTTLLANNLSFFL